MRALLLLSFTVAAGAQLRIVYFQGGRQETWRGPVTVKAGAQQSDAGSAQPAQVSTLPGAVPQKIAQVPELIQIAKLGSFKDGRYGEFDAAVFFDNVFVPNERVFLLGEQALAQHLEDALRLDGEPGTGEGADALHRLHVGVNGGNVVPFPQEVNEVSTGTTSGVQDLHFW